MRRLVFALPPLAAACATLTTPVPTAVRLGPQQVDVTMSDGAHCVGRRADAVPTARGWSGKLTECGQPLAYDVRLDAQGNIVQGALVQVFDAIGAKGLLLPGGAVIVTDARGEKRVFVSPKPIRWKDQRSR